VTYQEASTTFGIPLKALAQMKEQSLLSKRLTDADIEKLRFLSKIWGKDSYIRMQLARRTKEHRKKLVAEAGNTKIENYIYNRYLNLEEGKRMPRQQIAAEVIYYFKVEKINRKELLKTIERMRKKVYNMRVKEKKNQKENGQNKTKEETERQGFYQQENL
jgi:hypothetical protein